MIQKFQTFFANLHIKPILLYALLAVCSIAFAIATLFSIVDLRVFFTQSPLQGTKDLLVNVLGILAIAELIGTLEAYKRDGRIRVTYIIDTAVILMLKEVLTTWYRSLDLQLTFAALTITCVLVVLRIVSIQFSPDRTTAFAPHASPVDTKTTVRSPRALLKKLRQKATTTASS